MGQAAGRGVMEDSNVSTREQAARPATSPNAMYPVSLAAGSVGDTREPTLSAALEASLRLAASLLDQCADPDAVGDCVIDLDVGGYHWTVSRCLPVAPCPDPRLSPRELEIVRMVAVGLTNRAIASALDISPWTVATYLRRVFGKLDVNSRAAMVAQAVELGLYPGMDDMANGDSSV
jgi:DNA-binding CsgD family transcriptional regulator